MIIGMCALQWNQLLISLLNCFEQRPLLLSVRFAEDFDDDGTTFHPEYSHQIFGDE